jgi:hypothetical protein
LRAPRSGDVIAACTGAPGSAARLLDQGAEEAFITSTGFCICPIRTINGTPIGAGAVLGPLTKRLTDAYIRLVDCDFVAQYLRHIG